MRNHGISEHKSTMFLKDLALDVANFIETHNLKNLYLMGHSMGGRGLLCFLK